MPKKERDEVVSELASRVLSAMLEEVLMDVVLQSHQEIARSRTVCGICHTRCGAVHVPGPSSATTQAVGSSSHVSSPSGETKSAEANGSATTGTNTPVNGKSDGNVYFECGICNKRVASNRYAPHLSNCMGLSSSRRGAARSATTKTKLAAEAGRSTSPYLGSENGNISDDGKTTVKGKGKSRAKRTDEAEFSLNRKRPGSPSISPNKKPKKAKTSGSPAVRAKTDDLPGSPSGALPSSLTASQSKVPSRLRDSSIVSSIQHDQQSSSSDSPSRLSSPPRSISTPVSAPALQSPILVPAVAQKPKPKPKPKPKNGKVSLPPPRPPPKRPSPPRPPPPIIRMPEPDFLIDVEGEETGSSTDTDSD
ncbi:hypothetical protein B0H21DRAFT_737467 [Amylocystis lapponica]|nr:hypothetical protein B0H21DRAFT_737467 [Amylocystis lapponica]